MGALDNMINFKQLLRKSKQLGDACSQDVENNEQKTKDTANLRKQSIQKRISPRFHDHDIVPPRSPIDQKSTRDLKGTTTKTISSARSE